MRTLLLFLFAASLSAQSPVRYEWAFVAMPPAAIPDSAGNDVVTRVHDGDSYWLRGLADFVRIAGVDAPEPWTPYCPAAQPMGKEIGDSVRAYLKGRNVSYVFLGMDKYKRPLVRLFVDSSDFAETLLAKGWGWYRLDRRIPKAVRENYKSIWRKARRQKLGVFADPNAINPELWRARHPPIK